jgi:thiamine kinase-like enzyme
MATKLKIEKRVDEILIVHCCFSKSQNELKLYVIFYQNMPNLHNWHKSAERKISQKNPEYTPCHVAAVTI